MSRHAAQHGMRPLGDLLPHGEALRRILEACAPLEEPTLVPVTECVGRVLSEDVAAPSDVPAFDRAAMDGYAVRSADTTRPDGEPARLRRVGVAHAGERFGKPLAPGQCVQIATGAPLPVGGDAVVMVERTRLEGDLVVVTEAVAAGRNVSPRGSDILRGTPVLKAGTTMNPFRLAVAAAMGFDTLRVWRRPRVAVLSTGGELRPVGASLAEGQIHDSNGPALAALFRLQGADVALAEPIPDDVDALRSALRQHASQDLLVFSGGSSAGERDVLRDAVAAEGEVVFHGVRVKPGKPLLFGRVARSLVVGLPGYPTSCLSDAYLFVLPALDRLMHRPPAGARRVRARLAERVEALPDRLWFVPVRLQDGLAHPTYKDSGATTSLAEAVGYVAVEPGADTLEEGDEVDVVLF